MDIIKLLFAIFITICIYFGPIIFLILLGLSSSDDSFDDPSGGI